MSEAWREVRVFISSTFRDMQAERDHLVRFVFPRVREKLLARQLRLVDVDLRWGVTADQDAFDLCMTEIDRCRPRFIAILGGRYGWVPPPRTVETAFLTGVLAGTSAAGMLSTDERQSIERLYDPANGVAKLRAKPGSVIDVERYHADGEIAVAVFQRAGLASAQASITASEVLHGALEQLDEPLFRTFYFRDPAVTAAVPEPFAGDYREPPGSFAESALAGLKERITRSTGNVPVAPGITERRPLPVHAYQARWDSDAGLFTDLREFGERVEADLLASVDAEIGAAAEPLSGFAAEEAAMDAFIQTRTEHYVVGTRKIAFEELEEHASGDGAGSLTVLVGEPGSGKSAMLARFVRDYARSHPEDLLISHFVGASAASTDVRQLLRRLWFELVRGAELRGDDVSAIPDEWDKLREGFPDVVNRASESRRVVIVIDAVNQLDPAHQSHLLRWLPEKTAPGARIILSVLPGPVFDALQARLTPVRFSPIARLTAGDAGEIMTGFLERYRKTLDRPQREALLSKEDAGNPLYLLTALEELRTLGTYEEITSRIAELPEKTQPLFVWILKRLERDPGFVDEAGRLNGSHVVRRYCASIAVSRSGMAEWELADLASDNAGNVPALTRLLRPYLMYRGDLIDFFHGQLREAVRSAYLPDAAALESTHRSLADLFKVHSDPAMDGTWTGAASYARGVSELPFHLTEGRDWERLHDTLTDLEFLEAKCTHVAVQETGTGDAKRRTYGGVYELQDDYRRALEVFPA